LVIVWGAGLSRSELAGMGLVGEQIDRLYRSLYVYTVGFHDSLRSMFKHCKNPARLVENVWRSYIHVADAAIQVSTSSRDDHISTFTLSHPRRRVCQIIRFTYVTLIC
jgi:hypothetical protein